VMMILGGGEGVSNKDEAITAGVCSRVSLASASAEIFTGFGNTKIAAATIVDPCSWQQFIAHAVSPACPPWPQSLGADSCATPASPDECCVIAWPCAMHIFPSQHAIRLVCHGVTHIGAHSSSTANRHTHAPSLP